MTDYAPILTAVRQGIDLSRRVLQARIVESAKGTDDPVTIGDYGIQAILCRALSIAFPDDAVIAEESGNQFMTLVNDAQRAEVVRLLSEVLQEPVTEADVIRWLDHGQDRDTPRTWVIDPIDGTKGFIAARHYVVTIGILQNRQVAGGIMGAPSFPSDDDQGMLLYAQDNIAYAEPVTGGAAKRLQVSPITDAAQARFLESVVWGHTDFSRQQTIRQMVGMKLERIENIDSQEKYGRIAAGMGELYMRLPRPSTNNTHWIWDHVTGVALVEAAGGRVTDLDGSPLDFSQGRALANEGVIATNGHLHDRIVKATREILGI